MTKKRSNAPNGENCASHSKKGRIGTSGLVSCTTSAKSPRYKTRSVSQASVISVYSTTAETPANAEASELVTGFIPNAHQVSGGAWGTGASVKVRSPPAIKKECNFIPNKGRWGPDNPIDLVTSSDENEQDETSSVNSVHSAASDQVVLNLNPLPTSAQGAWANGTSKKVRTPPSSPHKSSPMSLSQGNGVREPSQQSLTQSLTVSPGASPSKSASTKASDSKDVAGSDEEWEAVAREMCEESDSEDEQRCAPVPRRLDAEGKAKPEEHEFASAEEFKLAKEAWRKSRKKVTERRRLEKQKEGVYSTNYYSGDHSESIRRMSEVKQGPLLEGHTFRDKRILKMRMLEEFNAIGAKKVLTKKSDSQTLMMSCEAFRLVANNSNRGWRVSVGVGHSGEAGLPLPEVFNQKEKFQVFGAKQLATVMLGAIRRTPGTPALSLAGLLEDKVSHAAEILRDRSKPEWKVLESAINNAKAEAKRLVFGEPSAQYLGALKKVAEKLGYIIELKYLSTAKIYQRIITKMHAARKKAYDEARAMGCVPLPENPGGINDFRNGLSVEAIQKIRTTMGLSVNEDPMRSKKQVFVGILLMPATATHQMPFTSVVNVDGAHVNFGKWTLLSLYGFDANKQGMCGGFALMFGNESEAI